MALRSRGRGISTVNDGPSVALTPTFLEQLYGTAAGELLEDEPAAPPADLLPMAA